MGTIAERRGGTRPPGWRRAVVVGVLACLAAVAGAAAGTAWTRTHPDDHSATAVILLHPLEGNAFSPVGRGDELVNLETEAQIVRSDAVARQVSEVLGGQDDPSDLLAEVEVSVPPNTQLLEITSGGPDDDTATARVAAFADVFLDYRRARTESAIFERAARLEELIRKREAERDVVLESLNHLAPASPAAALAEQQVQEVTVQISSLRAQLVAAQATSLDPGQLVTPGTPDSPGLLVNPTVTAVLGAVIAAALVIGVAVLRRGRRDDVIWSTDDLDDLSEADPPVLGQVTGTVRADDEVVALVRSAVLTAVAERPLVVSVGAAAEAAGPASAYPALVEAFARARYEVVSIDLTSPVVAAAVFELVNEESTPDDVLVGCGEFRSELRPAGVPRPGRADGLSDLAASAAMTRSMAELSKRADVVLLRPGAFGTPLGRAVMALSDVVVVESHAGHTLRGELEEVAAAASHTGARIAGVVHLAPAPKQGLWVRTSAHVARRRRA